MDKTLKELKRQTYNRPRVSLQENETLTRRKGEQKKEAARGSRIIKPEGNLLSRAFENYSARDSRILSRLVTNFSFGVSFLSIKKFLEKNEFSNDDPVARLYSSR